MVQQILSACQQQQILREAPATSQAPYEYTTTILQFCCRKPSFLDMLKVFFFSAASHFLFSPWSVELLCTWRNPILLQLSTLPRTFIGILHLHICKLLYQPLCAETLNRCTSFTPRMSKIMYKHTHNQCTARLSHSFTQIYLMRGPKNHPPASVEPKETTIPFVTRSLNALVFRAKQTLINYHIHLPIQQI